MKKLPFIIITIIIVIIIIIFIISLKDSSSPEVKYGVTFSPRYARYLKLDWQKTYFKVLDELKVKNLRLPGYWNSLEPEEKQYDFYDTDFMLDEAGKREAKVILVLGVRQPRWPECHIPLWAKKLTVEQRQERVLKFIQKVVERYKGNSAIWAWQVENEPFLTTFGEGCDPPDENFLRSEINLVKKLDKRPIILTDSGELGGWGKTMKLSDIFGISVYRTVYNPILGYQTYPVFPYFYNIKSAFIKSFLGRSSQETIIAELQAEPWLSMQGQGQLFSVQNLKENVQFGKKTGFDEIYLWGVEWWYWMDSQSHPEYLEHAKTLF